MFVVINFAGGVIIDYWCLKFNCQSDLIGIGQKAGLAPGAQECVDHPIFGAFSM